MRIVAVAVLAAALTLSACSGDATAPEGAGDGTTLTVSAAASLTEAFSTIADAFEADNPGVTVRLNFGGSSSLAEQVISGAPVDVLATASLDTMASVESAGAVEEPSVFATNALTIAVPPGNPAAITSLADLAVDGVRVARCDDDVPCGAAAVAMLANAGVALTPVTLDPDVKTVLGRVATGEVDAGLVYATDIASAEVDAVAVPADVVATTDYAIAVVTDSTAGGAATAFVDYVLGLEGQQALLAQGFGAP